MRECDKQWVVIRCLAYRRSSFTSMRWKVGSYPPGFLWRGMVNAEDVEFSSLVKNHKAIVASTFRRG